MGMGGCVSRVGQTSIGLAASLVIATWVAGVAWRAEAAAPTKAAAESYEFAFRDADIAQVAQEILGKDLGLSYSVDPSINGKMTFRIDQRMTKAQLLDAFEAALAANDVALVHDGESVALRPRDKARTEVGVRGVEQSSPRAGYEVVAVPLSWAAPSEVAKALEAIAPSNTVIYTNDKLGFLLLGGSGAELDSTLKTVRMFDRSGLEGSRIRWFELAQAPAQSVGADLEHLLTGAGASGVTVIPLKRLNGILVFAHNPDALDQVGQWVAKLDVPSREVAASLWVYHPRNASADVLAKSLNSVLSGQTGSDDPASGGLSRGPTMPGGPPPPPAPRGGGQEGPVGPASVGSGPDAVRVGVNKDSNTLLIQAPQAQWIQIQRILNEIDQAPSQVLIQASILEVTLTKDFQFGVDWNLLGAGGKLGASNITSNNTGAVGAQFPGFAVTYLDKDIKAAINALGAKTNVEVVSAPKIMTVDNRPAHLTVGDQVPTISQSAIGVGAPGAPIVSTFDYRSTGVILNVTPRISGDDKIVLDVDQEVSSASATLSSSINSPTIQERKFESTLVLRDGGVVALGGLISGSRTKGNTGMPGLMSLPGIGTLFRQTTDSNTRTELIVLLSATIIRDSAGADRAVTDLLADMKEIQGRGLLAHH
jgi:general secretion pathway protein D